MFLNLMFILELASPQDHMICALMELIQPIRKT